MLIGSIADLAPVSQSATPAEEHESSQTYRIILDLRSPLAVKIPKDVCTTLVVKKYLRFRLLVIRPSISAL